MIKTERQSPARDGNGSAASRLIDAQSLAEPALCASLVDDLPLPRHYAAPLLESSFQAVFYPLGFPIRILSNSSAILHAAQQSWGSAQPAFQYPPLCLRIGVKKGAGSDGILPPEPVHSLRGNLLVNSADPDNFVVANLKNGCALGWVTEATAASPLYLRYHFLEGIALSMISALRAVAVHGACLQVENRGVLLCGDSGAGKSTLAYAGARSGWTYISDDASYLLLDQDDSLVVGNSSRIRFRPSAARLFPEIDGRPVTPRAAGKPSIEVHTSEWPEIATAPSARIGQIVFLNRKRATHEVARLSPSQVMPWFMQHVLLSTSSRTVQEKAISRLLKADIFELRYQDLNWAIQRVNQIAREGR